MGCCATKDDKQIDYTSYDEADGKIQARARPNDYNRENLNTNDEHSNIRESYLRVKHLI